MTRWTHRALRSAALPLLFGAALAHAQNTTPVTLVVGFSAGGGVDTAARLIAQELTPLLGRSVIVENRPGAASMIAADAVARAAPDGNTLLFAGTAMLTAPLVSGNATYNPVTSFAPVAMLARSGLALAVPADSPIQTVADLVQHARAQPGALNYASSGMGSLHHLAVERLTQQAGLSMVHVPYKGGSQAATDLASGQVDIAVTSLSAVAPHVKSQRVKLVGVLSAEKDPAAPELPTVAQTVPGVDVTSAMFVLAPAGTAASTIDTLAHALQKVLNKAEVRAALERQDAWPAYLDPSQLRTWIGAEYDLWKDVITQAGLAGAR